MIEREKIKRLVKEIVEENKLQDCFNPIIEEFFFRVADQLDWDDEKLNVAISRYKKVVDIKFVNMYERESLLIKYKKQGARTEYEYGKRRTTIYFDVDDLKSILEFDKEKIENFINNAMHEQGHSIQVQEKGNKVNFGFCEHKIINKFGRYMWDSRDRMINEFAEVVNADRLQNVNIKKYEYFGYENIQTAAKIVLSSLGMSELELANLQFEPNAREEYEKLIANKLGSIPSEIYRDSFGEILDAIYNFSLDKKQRENLILQIDSLQILSKELFEKRFNDIIINSSNIVKDLARLSINQKEKDFELKRLFNEFNIKETELKINNGRNIYNMLSELGYDDRYLDELYYAELDELLETPNENDKQKHYDNEELIERLYQSFLKYPIKKVPLKDVPGVILSKIIGKVKRITFKQKKMLPEPNLINYNIHKDFVNRISNLEDYKEDEKIEQEDYIMKFEEEKDNNDENYR